MRCVKNDDFVCKEISEALNPIIAAAILLCQHQKRAVWPGSQMTSAELWGLNIVPPPKYNVCGLETHFIPTVTLTPQ